jgi:hypothetical protein
MTTKGNLLSRETLLSKEKLEIRKVDLEDGNYVYVRQMTGHERDIFEQSLMKKIRDKNGLIVSVDQAIEDFRAKLAVVTVCDETGKLILQPSDVTSLSQNRSAKTLDTIITEAQALNAITEKDKEELVKNSVAGQAGSSISDSAEN